MKNTILNFTFSFLFASAFSNVNASTPFRIDHDYTAILRDIAIDNACLTASEVRSRRAIRTCVRLESTVDRHSSIEPTPTWTCRAYANVTLAYPREVQTRTCTRWERPKAAEEDPNGACLVWSYQTLKLPRSIEVRVTEKINGDVPAPVTQVKLITFPDCP